MGMWRLTRIGIGGQLGVWKLSLPLFWDFLCGSNSNVSLKKKKTLFGFFHLIFLRNDKIEENFCSRWLKRIGFVMVCIGGNLVGGGLG